MQKSFWLVGFILLINASFAQELTTNAVSMQGAPKWVTVSRLNKISDRIERGLEWDIRRVRVIWYSDEAEFLKALPQSGGYDASVLALTLKTDQKILVGPKVKNEVFDGVFGHELAHVVLYQKYKQAIPAWLEEGLANFVSGNGRIDYKYLKTELSKNPVSIKTLTHPFGQSAVAVKLHYMLSSAVMKMIESHCKISDLLQLSVGEKLESYLGTFCGISDLDAEFAKWLARKN